MEKTAAAVFFSFRILEDWKLLFIRLPLALGPEIPLSFFSVILSPHSFSQTGNNSSYRVPGNNRGVEKPSSRHVDGQRETDWITPFASSGSFINSCT